MKIDDNRKYSIDEIKVIANSVIGKTFGELNNSELKTYNKGSFGHIFEEDVFGYSINSFSEPDFIDAGIELKVTPYKINKNRTLSAKERLVLNLIDFDNEYKHSFKSSHFWFKNNKIQIIWYLWEDKKKKADYKITHEKLLDLALSEDLKQIKKDWEDIIKKIKEGKAHEISEGDTMYLGACTKGADEKSSYRKQPKSDIMAKQRAFCFKTSYMTQLVRKYIGSYEDVEKIVKDINDTFENTINNTVAKYIGKTQKELLKEFNLKSNSKNINRVLINRMFNLKGDIGESEEFQKANIVPKTIRIEENGKIKESISFPAFKFTDLINQKWSSSDLKEQLENTKYMFFVFKKMKKDYIFKGVKLWNMPEIDIENHVKIVWKKTRDIIKTGNIVKCIKKGIRKTNFPGTKDNNVCHVRPHARNAKDTAKLPFPDKYTGAVEYTKHCFWINNNYIRNIFNEFV